MMPSGTSVRGLKLVVQVRVPEDFGSVKLALKNMSEGQSLFVSRGEYRMEASKASKAQRACFTCCTCFSQLFFWADAVA
jgi:hypothetical protein